MKKIFISVGDPSGDIHASRLMSEILKLAPDTQFIGIGGKEMEKINLKSHKFKSIVPMEKISVVGFWEVAKRYSFFKNLLEDSKNIIKNENIDLFLPIDYPGFNLRLAAFVKSINKPIIYYIAPQLWAWGRSRTEKVKSNVDKLLVCFPFEEDFFKNDGIDATFVGHPLLDDPILKNEVDYKNREKNLVALLPGSRVQEVKNHLSIFEKVIKETEKVKKLNYGIAQSSNIPSYLFDNILKLPNVKLWQNSKELMQKAEVGIVKTGTSNLEAALCNLPIIMMYLTSTLTYNIGKYLINLDYLSLINILQNKPIIPELIQQDAKYTNISNELISLIDDNERKEYILSEYTKIREKLGRFSASKKSAKIIIKYLKNEK